MSDHISSGGSDTAGVTYWRSLEQLENSAEFQQLVEREGLDQVVVRPPT